MYIDCIDKYMSLSLFYNDPFITNKTSSTTGNIIAYPFANLVYHTMSTKKNQELTYDKEMIES